MWRGGRVWWWGLPGAPAAARAAPGGPGPALPGRPPPAGPPPGRWGADRRRRPPPPRRRRSAPGEVGQQIVADAGRPLVVVGTDGHDEGIVGRFGDGPAARSEVPRGGDDRDACRPRPLHGEVERINPVALGRVRAQREV